jgi:hypothetical protein
VENVNNLIRIAGDGTAGYGGYSVRWRTVGATSWSRGGVSGSWSADVLTLKLDWSEAERLLTRARCGEWTAEDRDVFGADCTVVNLVHSLRGNR